MPVKQAKQPKNTSIHERLTDGFLALMMTVLVLSVSPKGYLDVVGVKWGAFLILCGGYAGLCVLLWLEEVLVGQRKLAELKDAVRESTWTQRLLLAYLLLTWVSALLSDYPKTAWLGGTRREGALTITLYVLCFLCVSRFGKPKAWMADLLAATVTAQAILCILQLRGGNPLALYPEGVNYFDAGKAYSGAYLGTIGNVDFVGAYFSLALPLLLAGILRMKARRRFWFLLPLALSAYVVVRMWVLSCIAGLAIGGLIALPVILPASKKARRGTALGLLGLALLGVIAVFAVDFGGVFHSLHELLHGNVPRSVDSGRLYIWREVLKLVPQHPLFGAGPDTLSLAGIEPFQRYDESLELMLYAGIDAAHSEYLNVLYHQGAFALAALLAALASALAAWVRRARENAAAAILGSAVLCYVVQASFNISMCFTASLFWCVLGLLDGCCRKNEQKGRKQ